jgi:hypothetical protein
VVLDTVAADFEHGSLYTCDVTMDDPGLAPGANDVAGSKELDACHAQAGAGRIPGRRARKIKGFRRWC